MKKIFFVALAAMIFAATGCKNESGNDGGQPASIKITLASGYAKAGSRAQDAVTETVENQVNNFSVLVFSGGLLEKLESYTLSNQTTDFTQTVNGLTTGLKRVVVVANVPTGHTILSYAAGTPYTTFAAADIDLDTQEPAQRPTNGLLMSGEITPTLAAGTNGPLTVPIHRAVARIELGTINYAIEDVATWDVDLFEITSVMIQKAKSLSPVVAGDLQGLTKIPFYGGLATGGSSPATITQAEKTYLRETANINDEGAENPHYFYVFPNNENMVNVGTEGAPVNVEGSTLFVIEATYNGVQTFFPVRINSNDADGFEKINRNTRYVLNITFKTLQGGGNPDVPLDPATLEVTIVPQGWQGPVTQNVEF